MNTKMRELNNAELSKLEQTCPREVEVIREMLAAVEEHGYDQTTHPRLVRSSDAKIRVADRPGR